MVRIVLALLALVSLTAFAPAPFPKTQRRGSDAEITLDTFQGNWRVVSLKTVMPEGKYELYQWEVTHVRIARTRWDYVAKGQATEPEGRSFSIDPTKKPAHFHFVSQGEGASAITGPGLIRRKGNVVEIVYTWGNANARSTSFEAPTIGHWLLTLERER